MTVFRSNSSADSDTSQLDGPVAITEGRLSDLIAFTLDHPELRLPGLPECSSRLNNAHRVYLVRVNGLVSAVAWTVDRDLYAESRSGQQSPSNAPVTTLYECWVTAGMSANALERLLVTLRGAASKAGAGFLVYGSSNEPALLAAVRRLGFLHEYEVTSYQVFRWRRDRIRTLG